MTRLTAGLDAINTAVAYDADEKHQLIAAKCRGLLCGYHARWSNADLEVIDCERIVTAPLCNIATSAKSRTFNLAGKLDVRATRNGRRLVVDHKTTSDEIEDPHGAYWRQLVVESQPSHYMWLEWMNGDKCDEAMWDVVRKPGISPKQVTKGDVNEVLSRGLYFGARLSDEALAYMRSNGRESLEMYTARLAHDCSTLRPQWYFQRRTIPRLDAELHEYAGEMWDTAQEIVQARRLQRWGKSPEACMWKHSPCEYLGICSGHDSPDSGNWQTKANVHTELPGLDGDGKDALTNSRMSCFRLCRRKHLYKYEMGIERLNEDEREALWFGSLWHLALEAWWNASRKDENGDCTTDAAGSELADANASH